MIMNNESDFSSSYKALPDTEYVTTKEMDDLLITLGKNISNSLTPLYGIGQLIENSKHEDYKEFGKIINTTSKVLNKYLESIKLLTSKAEKKEEFDHNLISQILAKHGDKIKIEYPTDETVSMNKKQLEYVLDGVIENALEASEDGQKVEVHFDHTRFDQNCSVTTGTLKPNKYFWILVEDDGKGIKTENLNEIFRPDYTTKAISNEYNGSGISLYVINKIIKRNGGEINVFSSSDKGTSFGIFLPIDQDNKLEQEFKDFKQTASEV